MVCKKLRTMMRRPAKYKHHGFNMAWRYILNMAQKWSAWPDIVQLNGQDRYTFGKSRRVYRCKALCFYNILDTSKLPLCRGILYTLPVNPWSNRWLSMCFKSRKFNIFDNQHVPLTPGVPRVKMERFAACYLLPPNAFLNHILHHTFSARDYPPAVMDTPIF